MKYIHALLAASGLLTALFLASCASTPAPKSYNIKVTLDAALAGSSVQIDLVGANELADLPRWQTYSVSEYWQPGNAFRKDAPKISLEFGRGHPESQVLSSTDPRWQRWLSVGAQHLVIIADLPGAITDQSGNADPRRLILPLDKHVWGGNETIEILVQESGLRLLTPRKP